jgi:hypothetical protein
MHIYVCLSICLSIYISTYQSIFRSIFLSTHTHTHTHTQTHTHTHTLVYIHVYIYICIYIFNTHTHTYTYTYIYLRTHIYTYTYIHIIYRFVIQHVKNKYFVSPSSDCSLWCGISSADDSKRDGWQTRRLIFKVPAQFRVLGLGSGCCEESNRRQRVYAHMCTHA